MAPKETQTISPNINSNLNADGFYTTVNESKPSTESSERKIPSCQLSVEDEICSDINKFNISSASCVSYETKFGTTVQIDDKKLQNGSTDSFHDKYNATSSLKIFEQEGCIVFLGEEKHSGLNVAIKRFECKETSVFEACLNEDGIRLQEVYVQEIAQNINVDDGKGSVLKVLDWYVYNLYFVVVTEYDEEFQSLFDCTYDQPEERFTEDECKTIFKLICKLIIKLNDNGIFHLDIKPSNFLYNTKRKEIKLLDFGHSIFDDTEENPEICYYCGTDGLYTPQQAEDSDYYGRDVDMWGVVQTLYFCLQGHYAFCDDSEILHKELEFNDEVSEECRDFLTKMLAYNVEDRLNQNEIFEHPWLKKLYSDRQLQINTKLFYTNEKLLCLYIFMLLCFVSLWFIFYSYI